MDNKIDYTKVRNKVKDALHEARLITEDISFEEVPIKYEIDYDKRLRTFKRYINMSAKILVQKRVETMAGDGSTDSADKQVRDVVKGLQKEYSFSDGITFLKYLKLIIEDPNRPPVTDKEIDEVDLTL